MSTMNAAEVVGPLRATAELVEQPITKLRAGEDVLVPARRGLSMTPDGLRRFDAHTGDPLCPPFPPVDMQAVDPETAARRHLAGVVGAAQTQALPPGMAPHDVEFVLLGTETVALTGARVVRFIQHFHRIPVYGSLARVELNADNTLVCVHTALGRPAQVDRVATVSPSAALAAVGPGVPREPPWLAYFYDNHARWAVWRLVYIVAGIPVARVIDASTPGPDLADYVVDAHSGVPVARLERVQSGVR